MKNKYVFVLIILFQVSAICVVGVGIYNKSRILGMTSIDPLKKENFKFNQSKNLKYFYEPRENQTINVGVSWLDETPVNTTNSDTFNERFDYPIEKDPETFRIITLGDSFTYGAFVNTEDNWSEKLEDLMSNSLRCKNIKKIEVINLGVEGYDAHYEFERFKRRGVKYNPDLVLWFLSRSDFEENLEISKPLVEKHKKELQKSGKYQEMLNQGIVYPEWNEAHREMKQKYTREELLFQTYKSLIKINEIYDKRLVIFSFADIANSYKELIFNFEKTDIEKISSFFLEDISKNGYLKDGHPNEIGHEEIAMSLHKFIIDTNIIPCDIH